MRVVAALAVVVFGVGCGQKVDHSEAAAPCNPSTMRCTYMPPDSAEGGDLGDGGASSGSGEQITTLAGQVLTYADDFFNRGTVFSAQASVSATGESGARVRGNYDGSSFQIPGVLKDSANWILVEPADAAAGLGGSGGGGSGSRSGMLPTLTPLDTRAQSGSSVTAGLVPNLVIDGVFANLGTERSTGRAQIVLRVVDQQGRSVTGAHADLTAEKVAYRTSGAWVANDEGTDDSGLILLANVPTASALSSATIALSGPSNTRVDVAIQAGAVTIATAVVQKK